MPLLRSLYRLWTLFVSLVYLVGLVVGLALLGLWLGVTNLGSRLRHEPKGAG